MVPLNSIAHGSPRRNPGKFAEKPWADWMFNIESEHHKQKIRKIIPQEVSKSQAVSF